MQVLKFYDHLNGFYGGLWFKIVDDMMMSDNSNSPQGLFVSLQFTGTVLVNWYYVKCQFTNPGRSSEILGGTPVFEQIEQIHEIGQIHQQSNNYSVGTARQRNSEWICQICEINLRTKIEFGIHWKSFNMI